MGSTEGVFISAHSALCYSMCGRWHTGVAWYFFYNFQEKSYGKKAKGFEESGVSIGHWKGKLMLIY